MYCGAIYLFRHLDRREEVFMMGTIHNYFALLFFLLRLPGNRL